MHSAVLATGGPNLHQSGIQKVLIPAFFFFAGSIFSTFLTAQTDRVPAPEDTPETVRRIQRSGDGLGKNEWQPELSAPLSSDRPDHVPGLPDKEQQQQLDELLSSLAANPAKQSTLQELDTLLNDVLHHANAAIDDGESDLAARLLEVVRAVRPEFPGLRAADARLQSLAELQSGLDAARTAMNEGRVDQPADNSAWYFYGRIAGQYPENKEARSGLLEVQQDMLSRAIRHAAEMDFDAAEQLLDRAESVLDQPDHWEQARGVIESLKTGYAESLRSMVVQLMDAGDFGASERVLIDLIALGGQAETVAQLRQRMEEAINYGGFETGQIIRDQFRNADIWTPESVVIPMGSFLMGSPDRENGRAENEGPRHRVTFNRGFAIGRHEVSVAEFSAFVSSSGFRTDAERLGRSTVYDAASGRLAAKAGVYWQMDYQGKPAGSDDPVIHVSWNDGQAYVSWLANGTGKPYRLPSEAEFEYVLRAGSNTPYWWGSTSPAGVVENITGENDSSGSRRYWAEAFPDYGDNFWGPAPTASFESNPFGLFDAGGNLSEWVGDCWHDTYVRAPLDGSAWINPGCDQRVIRGGHWASLPDQTRSAYRRYAPADYRDARVGIRIARDL